MTFIISYTEEEEALDESAQVAELSNDSDAPLKPNVNNN